MILADLEGAIRDDLGELPRNKNLTFDNKFIRWGKNNKFWFYGWRYGDNFAASYGSWKDGEKYRWYSKGVRAKERKNLDSQDKKLYLPEEEKRQTEAIEEASAIYERGNEIREDIQIPYFVKKKMTRLPRDIKFGSDSMGIHGIIPLYSTKHQGVVAIQRLYEFDKRFNVGALRRGSYYMFGDFIEDDKDPYAYICEGFSTGYAIWKAMKRPVFVAFAANNLPDACTEIQNKYGAKKFIICGDNDDEGDSIKYCKMAENRLLNVIIRFADKGKDFWDMWNEDVKSVKKKLFYKKSFFTEVTPLGVRENNFYYYTSRGNVVFSCSHKHSNDMLFSLAPFEFWVRKFPKKEGNYDEIDFNSAKIFLKEKCIMEGAYDQSKFRESGFFLNHKKKIYLWNGKESFGEKDINYRHVSSKGYRVSISPYDLEKAYASFRNFVKEIKRFSWLEKIYAEQFSAWLPTSIVCGALKWKPHIYFTGSSSTGKSWTLSNVVSRVLDKKCLKAHGDSTAAGIRNFLSSNQIPIAFDEFEKTEFKRTNDEYQRILNFLKLSSSDWDGAVIKGTSTQDVNVFTGNTMACLASIVLLLKKKEDFNRFLIFEFSNQAIGLREFEKIEADIARMPLEEFSDLWTNHLFSRFEEHQMLCKEESANFSDILIKRYGNTNNHVARNLGTMAATCRIFNFEIDREAWVTGSMKNRAFMSNEQECFNYLMTSVLEVDRKRASFQEHCINLFTFEKGNIEVGYRTDFQKLYKMELGVLFEGRDLYISKTHSRIKEIFSKTPQWDDGTWADCLLKNKNFKIERGGVKRFGAVASRTIVIKNFYKEDIKYG